VRRRLVQGGMHLAGRRASSSFKAPRRLAKDLSRVCLYIYSDRSKIMRFFYNIKRMKTLSPFCLKMQVYLDYFQIKIHQI
jgi:hypothetical protein